jgi:hypothetical protein
MVSALELGEQLLRLFDVGRGENMPAHRSRPPARPERRVDLGRLLDPDAERRGAARHPQPAAGPCRAVEPHQVVDIDTQLASHGCNARTSDR